MVQLRGDAKRHYVADLFSRIAPRYDLMNSLITLGMHRRWKRETARRTSQGLVGPALDIATGTGDLVLELAQHPNIQLAVGVDLLPEMLALGRTKAAGRPGLAETTLALADALALPFPDDSFACATAGFSLRNMPDLALALAEMARVVRPGGRVTTLELTPLRTGVKARLFRPYFHLLVPLLGRLIAGDRAAYTYLPQSVDYFPDAPALARMYEESGLVEVGYELLGFGTVALHWGSKPLL
jgi:demethylmenaquinone methyltransferase/2-methoxy-6-polyprenyl-1,4-benzoquinol methylase